MYCVSVSWTLLTWIIEISKLDKQKNNKWFGFQFLEQKFENLQVICVFDAIKFFQKKYAKTSNLSYRKWKITKAKYLRYVSLIHFVLQCLHS